MQLEKIKYNTFSEEAGTMITHLTPTMEAPISLFLLFFTMGTLLSGITLVALTRGCQDWHWVKGYYFQERYQGIQRSLRTVWT